MHRTKRPGRGEGKRARNKKRRLPMRGEALGFRGPQPGQRADGAGPARVWRGSGRKMGRRRLAPKTAQRGCPPKKGCERGPRRAGGSCSGEGGSSLGGPCRGGRTKARLLPIARRQIRPVAVGGKERLIGDGPSRGGDQPRCGSCILAARGRAPPRCKAGERRGGHALGRAGRKTPQPAGNPSPDRRSCASPLPSSCRSPQPVRRTSRARLSISSTTAG